MSRNIHVDSMIAGDTYADILVWRWDRTRSRWIATVRRDGVQLIVRFEKRGHKRSFWRAELWDVEVHVLPEEYKHPDTAQIALFEFYKKKYPVGEDRR